MKFMILKIQGRKRMWNFFHRRGISRISYQASIKNFHREVRDSMNFGRGEFFRLHLKCEWRWSDWLFLSGGDGRTSKLSFSEERREFPGLMTVVLFLCQLRRMFRMEAFEFQTQFNKFTPRRRSIALHLLEGKALATKTSLGKTLIKCFQVFTLVSLFVKQNSLHSVAIESCHLISILIRISLTDSIFLSRHGEIVLWLGRFNWNL